MKKIVLLLAMFTALGAQALDFSISNGRDRAVDKDFVAYSLGGDVAGLNVAASVQSVRDTYNGYGLSASKTIPLGPVSVAPVLGVRYFDPTTGTNGTAATVGVTAGYALAKNATLFADFTRRFNLRDAEAFQGNQLSGGLKVSF